MISKKTIRRLGVLLVLLLLSCGAKRPNGVYYGIGEWDRKTYLELRSDGTFFYSYKQKRQFSGKFTVENGGISLTFEFGQAARLRSVGDTLIGDGSQMNSFVRWHKGGNGFAFEQAVDRASSKRPSYLPAMSDSARIVAIHRYLDLLVEEGFMSRDEAAEAKKRGVW